MGTIFTLTQDIRNITQAALDDLLNELGKTCTLIYPPIMENCVNCVFDSIGNKSANRWMNGGPFPFPEGGICPSCGGSGLRAEEYSEDILMSVISQPSKFWVKPPANVQIPAGTIQTKGFLTDLEKVQRARKMILQPEISHLVKYTYVLRGEPVDISNIVPGRYFYCMWERVG